MIIGVFGISGVGKTTICTNLQNTMTNVVRVSASEIIRKYGGLVDYEVLSKSNLDTNQKLLVEGVKMLKNSNQTLPNPATYLLELHNVLETPNGLQKIGVDVFRELSLDWVVFLAKPESEIATQRLMDSMRVRVESSVGELRTLQLLAKQHFESTFSFLDIPLNIIVVEHTQNFQHLIESARTSHYSD
ncbi:AAA family ATPase [Vibrio vulnificus]|uniref:ATP-binding protein n=1 Tax=Vibrio vulnificus TaxID=672 RepID=UPI001CDB88FA|nr:AAA family ATPase [Vibrio vulnificus]MCA3897345.1 AAA family ATPase [Vibrio vulnificus]MCU8462173.1 ATP-binding protein [Vibrio vulnificus]